MNLADRMPQTSQDLTGFLFSSKTALVCPASFGVCPLSGQAQGTEEGQGPAGRPRGRRPSSCWGGLHGVRRASPPSQASCQDHENCFQGWREAAGARPGGLRCSASYSSLQQDPASQSLLSDNQTGYKLSSLPTRLFFHRTRHSCD